jgi:hypothetical protein
VRAPAWRVAITMALPIWRETGIHPNFCLVAVALAGVDAAGEAKAIAASCVVSALPRASASATGCPSVDKNRVCGSYPYLVRGAACLVPAADHGTGRGSCLIGCVRDVRVLECGGPAYDELECVFVAGTGFGGVVVHRESGVGDGLEAVVGEADLSDEELAARGESRIERARQPRECSARLLFIRIPTATRTRGSFGVRDRGAGALTISADWLLNVLVRDVSIPFCARPPLVGLS